MERDAPTPGTGSPSDLCADFDTNGVVAEATLPDQVIKVYVRVNYGRAVRKVAGWTLLMVAGGALGAWGRELYPVALEAAGRLWGLLEYWPL